ncbi:MAG: DedA family protein [Bacillota bacterium]|nr:DedA family protein [Bacillota bacterium]
MGDWIGSALQAILDAMATLGYPGLLVGMALESAGAPLPSEVLLPFAGWLVDQGRMGFLEAALVSTLGGAAGYLGLYAVGRYGGRPFVERWGRYVLLKPADLDRAEDWFRRYGPAAVFFARMVPVMRGLISLPAGAARMSPATFTLYSVAGSVPWTVGLLWAGTLLGQHWADIQPYFHWFTLAVAVLLVVAVAWWAAARLRSGALRT